MSSFPTRDCRDRSRPVFPCRHIQPPSPLPASAAMLRVTKRHLSRVGPRRRHRQLAFLIHHRRVSGWPRVSRGDIVLFWSQVSYLLEVERKGEGGERKKPKRREGKGYHVLTPHVMSSLLQSSWWMEHSIRQGPALCSLALTRASFSSPAVLALKLRPWPSVELKACMSRA